MHDLIYKICSLELWQQSQEAGVFAGAPIDTADGFIHFSNSDQLAETAAKHFSGQPDLLLLTVSAESLGNKLKWEPSRGGDLFPHLYGALSLESVVQIDPLPLSDDGTHVLPQHVRGG